MSNQGTYERILALLYDAMLDDTRWPATSALIDEACGITGNALLVGEGPQDDIRVLPVGLYYRGQCREDLERDYVENGTVYHSASIEKGSADTSLSSSRNCGNGGKR